MENNIFNYFSIFLSFALLFFPPFLCMYVCGFFSRECNIHSLVMPSQPSDLNLSAKFRKHHAVILRTLKTCGSHLRKGSRHGFLQHARKLFSSHPARSLLEQVKAHIVSHANGELLKTEDP